MCRWLAYSGTLVLLEELIFKQHTPDCAVDVSNDAAIKLA